MMDLATLAIIDLAETICGSREQAVRWFHSEPIDVFDHQTAEQLVNAGCGADVMRFLESLKAGPLG